ncbi:MAG: hypothetical protein Q4G43_03000 [Mobilicoccus sp.]|nr:hypothetical protein [Mobilicoccus sp.]
MTTTPKQRFMVPPTIDQERGGGERHVDVWVDEGGHIVEMHTVDSSDDWLFDGFVYGLDLSIQPPPQATGQ